MVDYNVLKDKLSWIHVKITIHVISWDAMDIMSPTFFWFLIGDTLKYNLVCHIEKGSQTKIKEEQTTIIF